MARTHLASASVFPPGASASAVLAAPWVNAASKELMLTGMWRGTKRKVQFAVLDGQITLPRNLLTVHGGYIMGEEDEDRCAWRLDVFGETYEFLDGGFGLINESPCNVPGFVSQGEHFVTFRNLPSAGRIKIVNSTSEGACQMNIRGMSGGAKVFTRSACGRTHGENLTLPSASGTSRTTDTIWDAGNSLYGIVKPITNGTIEIYHVASDSTETWISRMESGEQSARYRRYAVPQETGAVVALCQLQHVDALADADPVIPGCLPAIETSMQAIGFRRKSEEGRYNTYMGIAMELLNKELEQYDSPASLGTMQIDPVLGLGNLEALV